MKDENLFSTKDLPLITVLSLDFPVFEIDKSNPREVVFSFKKSNELQARVTDYWDNNILIAPQRFYTQMKYVKSQIYGRTNA